MTELTNGAHLTTSRVNRLLRPLRNKCNTLAALPKPEAASRVTYSKQSSNWDPDACPPLSVLPPPEGTKKLSPGRRSSDDFELSRRIHAVCDAFKNIAHVSYVQQCSQRIPSLAALCTLVVGGNIPPTNFDNTLVDSDECLVNENDLLDADCIYEAVPPHYRRFLIVSHALSMVLYICTHHHTLVSVLLDHCLSFGLVYESTHLLDIILTQAFLPFDPSYPPPATHPAHTNYLLDLHAKWTNGNKSSRTSPDSLLFTTSTFCQAVLNAVSKSSCNSYILWTSKVLNRLLHAVENCDIDSYVFIVYTLSRSFWGVSGPSPDDTRDDAQSLVLRAKLSELMSSLFDLLFTQSDSRSSALALSRINAAIDILHECRVAGLHRLRTSIPNSPIDLPNMITVFTTHILVAFRDSIDNSDCLLAILDDSSPVPTTFSKLMVYFSRFQDSQMFGDFLEAFLAQLKMYSSALRSEKLFAFDASLWACALRHFETSIATSQKSNSSLVTRYKQQLMEGVDTAERRCFGGDIDSSSVITPSVRSNHAKHTKRGRLSGHWEWEDMVGSWIRKTPVRKKRKVDKDRLHRHSSGYTGVSALTPLSTCHRRLTTLSPTPSSQSSEPGGSDYRDETDKENCPSSPPPVYKVSRPIKRRSSNFLSLLADAQTNRVVLHPKPRPEPKLPVINIPEKHVLPLSSQGSRHAPPRQAQKPSYRMVPPPTPSRIPLLSDDSLDLFAHTSSSPDRC